MHTRTLGMADYASTLAAMQEFTESRTPDTADELWICEHPSTFTQGLAGKPDHLLHTGDIPVVQSNRGGQVTFHGPGQVVAYPLINLQRAGYFVKEYVYRLEEALIRTLAELGVTGHRVAGAPGIYVRLDDPFSHAPLAQRPGRMPSKVSSPTACWAAPLFLPFSAPVCPGPARCTWAKRCALWRLCMWATSCASA